MVRFALGRGLWGGFLRSRVLRYRFLIRVACSVLKWTGGGCAGGIDSVWAWGVICPAPPVMLLFNTSPPFFLPCSDSYCSVLLSCAVVRWLVAVILPCCHTPSLYESAMFFDETDGPVLLFCLCIHQLSPTVLMLSAVSGDNPFIICNTLKSLQGLVLIRSIMLNSNFVTPLFCECALSLSVLGCVQPVSAVSHWLCI
jgi:hypothetical protein